MLVLRRAMSPTIARSSSRTLSSSQATSLSSRLLTVAVRAASGVLSSCETDESRLDLRLSASRSAAAAAAALCRRSRSRNAPTRLPSEVTSLASAGEYGRWSSRACTVSTPVTPDGLCTGTYRPPPPAASPSSVSPASARNVRSARAPTAGSTATPDGASL